LDNPDEPLPITPAHLLFGRALAALPDAHAHGLDTSIETKWKLRQHLERLFWRRWQREYLPELMAFHKWTTEKPDLRIGDLVLVEEHQRQRHEWPLGFIEQVIVGRDGHVRAARVRVGKPKPRSITRPIQRLYPLEGTPVRPSDDVERGEGQPQPVAETAEAEADAASEGSDELRPAESSTADG